MYLYKTEEWKRRYEKEREKCSRIKRVLENYETELKKWRGGMLTNLFTTFHGCSED